MAITFSAQDTSIAIPTIFEVALKYVRKDEDEELQLPGMETPMPKEVRLFQMVHTPSTHPNILKVIDWFDRPASYVMAMERPDPCKDLFTYCQEQGGVLDEDQACSITGQLLGGTTALSNAEWFTAM
ncbi:serine/threonine-protein kinase pim-1-like isoform X2 [Anguilla anguilla]|uniref:serine/threonine-protein kinase pim-1-like isoform X2 n=1 Tax=Anguilla anguilla TaxID=7936 RepID=UPI0015A8C57A|nr:serine/threonine-protein kinase pim-1-like isoform X2 [Anguilla anguilla]